MNTPRRLMSVRARLTLWNVGVLTLVLVVLGGAFRYIVSATLLSSADQQLQARAARLQRQWQRRVAADRTRTATSTQRTPDAAPDTASPRLVDRTGASLRPLHTERRPLLDRAAFADALAGQSRFSTIRVDGDKLRVYSAPLRDTRGRVQGVVQVPFQLDELQQGLHTLDRTLLILIPLGLIIAGGGGAFLTLRALQPVRHLMEATDRIEAENLSGRLSEQGNDEFAELAKRFNRMLARLEASFERLSRFTADASHELRTPLAIIKANTSRALDQPPTLEQYQQMMLLIDSAAGRCSRIVQDLLFLARNDNASQSNRRVFHPLPVAALLSDVESLSLTDDPQAPRLIVEEPASTLTVCGDAHELSRALGNLVENALRYTPPTGTVTVCAVADNTQVRITVTDTGEGIAPEHLPHLFERFYRADPNRSRSHGGTGLGLAIAQSIAHAHHGTLALKSQPGHGTRAILSLPLFCALS